MAAAVEAMDGRGRADGEGWLGLRDARVLVAGAGGLGSACATGFAEAGARVLVVDHSVERAEAVAAELESKGASAAALATDLRERSNCAAAVADIEERWGRIDVCVHSVGTNRRQSVLDFDEEQWREIVDLNLTSAFWLAQAAGRSMLERGYGRIVLFSSVSGVLGHKHHAPYAASKGGINQMMRVMAAEWAASGVTVNAVAPGYVETALTRDYLERDGNRERLEGQVPAGRLGTPEEVVGPVLFLASRQAGFVTGHVLYVDGGRTLT